MRAHEINIRTRFFHRFDDIIMDIFTNWVRTGNFTKHSVMFVGEIFFFICYHLISSKKKGKTQMTKKPIN